jgi:hypothetical protein
MSLRILEPGSPVGHPVAEHCPWCGQAIPHEKFDEIHQRIEAKERERTIELEKRLKDEVARQKAETEAKAKVQVDQVRKDAATALAKANQDTAAKVKAAREAANTAAEVAVKQRLADAEKARKSAELQLQAFRTKQEATLNQRLQEQRTALEKAKMDAVNGEKAKTFKEKLKLEEKLQLMQRQLQNKTANELGEGAEVDLFEVLRGRFPQDDIKRVGKGTEGADIVHKVMESGRECGCIVYDSKNRNSWRNGYVSKLRRDQLAAQADHAILATQVFPAGSRQLHLQDGVIVSNPARIAVLVEVLRKHLTQTHSLRLSNEARTEKMARLYEFVISERCGQLLDEIDSETDGMLDLDVKEKKAHDATWKHRGELIRSVQRVHGELSSEIDRIIGGPSVARVVRVK